MDLLNYRDLKAWQLSMDLVERVYAHTGKFPAHEMYGLSSQLRRAAVSIPSNIAEGNARQYRKEYVHALSIALGSLGELDTQFEIAYRLKFLAEEDHHQLKIQLIEIRRVLHGLRRSLAPS